MTLVASHPTVSINHPTCVDDNESECSSDNENYVIQPQEPPYSFANALVQALGHPDGDAIPQIGKIQVENSSDVHFGDKNFYQGPVTIRQIVYSNGDTNLKADKNDKTEVNLGYDISDGDNFEASERKDNINNSGAGSVPDRKCDASSFRKGISWLKDSKYRSIQIGAALGLATVLLIVLAIVLLLHTHPDITDVSQIKNRLRMISRAEWLAQPPTNDTTPLVTPVQYVIIHHTATENCSSQSQCVFYVRQIQTYHIESRGWYDIGYNFLVGGDGAAYEGRGWIVEGAHTLGWNSKSIGIAFVGTFLSKVPPDIQILTCKRVIERGVELGYIRKDYKLLGARQLFATESPGIALLENLKTWDHWVKEP
ncbi:unnamed protein product [Ceutorhynchus assimilis]|uniref:Uncharacterized protein n=1 Tax=Ceutorhynchus assimilis TaxID=467358 RepID=A0A9P0GN85_9CUCU|nr:unnamed protein product [Ceutorhynchus assimilis]